MTEKIFVYKYKRRNISRAIRTEYGSLRKISYYSYIIVYNPGHPKTDSKNYYVEWIDEDFYLIEGSFFDTKEYQLFIEDVKSEYRLITGDRYKKFIVKSSEITKIVLDAKLALYGD